MNTLTRNGTIHDVEYVTKHEALLEADAASAGWAFVCQQTFIVLGIATPFTTDIDARRIQNDIARRTSRIVAREPVSTQYLSEWSKAVARGETPILPNAELRDAAPTQTQTPQTHE